MNKPQFTPPQREKLKEARLKLCELTNGVDNNLRVNPMFEEYQMVLDITGEIERLLRY